MMASALLGGGALALRARGRFCTLPEPRGTFQSSLSNMGRDSKAATCLSHLASWEECPTGSSPKPPCLCDMNYICCDVCVFCAKYLDMK